MSDAGNNPPPLPPEPPRDFGALPPMPPSPGGGGGFPPAGDGAKPPGMVTTIGILVLVGGALDIVLNLFWVVYVLLIALGTFGIGLLCCIFPIAGLISGVLNLMHGIKMVQNPSVPPSQPLAIAQVCSVLWCGMLTMVCGILVLVFSKNPEVVAWYNRSQ